VSLKILLADDSLTAQNMAKKILADAGYQVIAVSNGAQAMKKIASDQPDLVVLDVYMPGYSGLELCERMRNSRETARTPVVLSVGKMEAFRPEEGTRVRADGLIVKPFEATELLAVVQRLAENLSPAPPAKPQPEPEGVTETAVEPTAAAESEQAEPEFDTLHHSVEIPQEFASTPAIGMEHIPDEVQAPAAPIEFEVERDPAPVELDEGPRMASAAGFSGVFDMEAAAPAAVAKPAEPAPLEEFQRFTAEGPAAQQAHEPVEDTGAARVEHEFRVESPEPFVGEVDFDSHTEPVAETWSAPAVDASPEASAESASLQEPEILPELVSWDEPGTAPSVEAPDLSLDPADHSAKELAAVEYAQAGPVWVAEETEIEPHESAVSLHKQMQQEATTGEILDSGAEASPVASAETSFESWETEEPLVPDPHPPGAETSGFDEAATLPEFEDSPQAPPVEQLGTESMDLDPAGSSPDFPADFRAATEAQSGAESAPALVTDHAGDAVSEFLPPSTLPRVTEAPVDPARIAHIVEEALERLKPELIAAVTRELEKKDR
jgi:CheY-like chemotaxis protein